MTRRRFYFKLNEEELIQIFFYRSIEDPASGHSYNATPCLFALGQEHLAVLQKDLLALVHTGFDLAKSKKAKT